MKVQFKKNSKMYIFLYFFLFLNLNCLLILLYITIWHFYHCSTTPKPSSPVHLSLRPTPIPSPFRKQETSRSINQTKHQEACTGLSKVLCICRWCSCETPNNGKRDCTWPSCLLLGNLDMDICVQSSCNVLYHVQLILFAFLNVKDFQTFSMIIYFTLLIVFSFIIQQFHIYIYI